MFIVLDRYVVNLTYHLHSFVLREIIGDENVSLIRRVPRVAIVEILKDVTLSYPICVCLDEIYRVKCETCRTRTPRIIFFPSILNCQAHETYRTR